MKRSLKTDPYYPIGNLHNKIRKKEFEVDILVDFENTNDFLPSKKFLFPITQTQREDNKFAILISKECKYKIKIKNNTKKVYFVEILVDGKKIQQIESNNIILKQGLYLNPDSNVVVENHIERNVFSSGNGFECVTYDLSFKTPKILKSELKNSDFDMDKISKQGLVEIYFYEATFIFSKIVRRKNQVFLNETNLGDDSILNPVEITETISKERSVASTIKAQKKRTFYESANSFKDEVVHYYNIPNTAYTKYSFQAASSLNLFHLKRLHGIDFGDDEEEIEKHLINSNTNSSSPSSSSSQIGSLDEPIIIIDDDDNDNELIPPSDDEPIVIDDDECMIIGENIRSKKKQITKVKSEKFNLVL